MGVPEHSLQIFMKHDSMLFGDAPDKGVFKMPVPRPKFFIQQEIATLERELRDAEEWERKLESGSPVAIGALIHNRNCNGDHVHLENNNYCDWATNPKTQQRYEKMATELIKEKFFNDPMRLGVFIQFYEDLKKGLTITF